MLGRNVYASLGEFWFRVAFLNECQGCLTRLLWEEVCDSTLEAMGYDWHDFTYSWIEDPNGQRLAVLYTPGAYKDPPS